jgi:hypothetical protein
MARRAPISSMARRAPAKFPGGVPAGGTGDSVGDQAGCLTGGRTLRCGTPPVSARQKRCGTLPVSVRQNESKDRVEARVSPDQGSRGDRQRSPRRGFLLRRLPGARRLAYSAMRVATGRMATGSMGRRDGTEDDSGRLRAEKI